MKNQLRGCVRINASGKHLYRFINMIHSGHICCFGQYCKNDVFYGEIYRHDLPKVRRMAEDCGVELKSAEYRTLSSVALKYRKRIGIILGLFLVLGASLYFSNVVVTIEIQGNEIVSDNEILSALSELDIEHGTPLRNIDFHRCENELRLMVDKIAWAGIRHTGNRVVVEVTEIVDKPQIVPNRAPCNLVSAKNAYITAVTVRDGLLMHKVGDFVPQGSLLVSGVSEDKHGHVLLHHSMGEIMGIYEEKVTFSEPFAKTESLPTGNTEKRRRLRLFSLEIPLSVGSNKFENFSTVTSEVPLHLFGKELPISFIREKITEKESSDIIRSDKELESLLMEKIYLYEKNFIGKDTKLTERSIDVKRTDSELVYTVTYTLEGNIARQHDIYVKSD